MPWRFTKRWLHRQLMTHLADAHYVSGVAYLRLGMRDSAVQEAETTLQIDPKFANAYLLKSQALVSFLGDVIVRDTADEPSKGGYTQAGAALEKYLQQLEP